MGSNQEQVSEKGAAGSAAPADEMLALFSEKVVGPYTVKPWSFGKAIKVYPAISRAITELRARGLDWGNLVDAFTAGQAEEIIGLILPVLPPLIAATLDISQEEVEGLEMGLGVALALTIVSQNVTQIKNFLPLVMESTKAMTGAA